MSAALLSGCLPIEPPDGALACAAPPDVCPPGYACGGDNRCRRPASINAHGDMSIGGHDDPDLAPPPPDLAHPPSDLAIVCPNGATMCDDFETGSFDRWSYSFLGPPHPSKILKIDGTEVHGGSRALHASVSSNTEDSYLYVGYQFAPQSEPLALRMWVKPLKALNNTAMVARLFNVNNGFQLGGDASGYWFIVQDIGTGPEVHSTTPIGINQWTCVELVVAGGKVQLFLDNSSTPVLDFVPKSPMPYNELHAGVEWAPRGVPVDVWIDDVAFGTSRLHCSN
jgi:hypothetical protein